MHGDSRSCTRSDVGLLLLLALGALAMRLYFLQFYEVISSDGISYIAIAKEFISGRGLASATHYPPLYPILLGLVSTLCNDPESAGLAVSLVMGSLLVVPVYLLGIEFFDRRVGFAAAVLSATWPTLRYWSTAVMSQATYITLLLLGIYCLWVAFRKSAFLPALFAGLLFAGANLTRSEAVLVLAAQAFVLILFIFLNRLPRAKLLYVLLSLAVFLMACSPYMAMLHELTGKWQLTGKSRITIADALSEYLRIPDLKHDPLYSDVGYLDLVRLYPEYIRTNYLKNIETCWREMLPFYGWILAAVGFIAGGVRGERLWQRFYLLASLAPLTVIVIFFFIGPEYTQPYLPVLFLFIGNGLAGIAAWAGAGASGITGGGLSRRLGYVPVCLALLYGSWNIVRELPAERDLPYHYTRDGGRLDEKRVGLKLARMLPADAVLITRSGRIGFYSGRSYLTPPQADYAGIIDFARRNKASYLIVSPQLLNMRPQLKFLYAPAMHPDRSFVPPRELELLSVDQEPGGQTYIIYRFKFI